MPAAESSPLARRPADGDDERAGPVAERPMDPVDDPERTARGAGVVDGNLDGAALELVPAAGQGLACGGVQDQRSEADQQEHGRQQSERNAARSVGHRREGADGACRDRHPPCDVGDDRAGEDRRDDPGSRRERREVAG